MEERKGGHITSLKKTHLSLSPSVGLGLEGGSVEDFYADKHKPNQTNPTPSTTHHYKALLSTFFLHPFALFLKRKVFSPPLSLSLSLSLSVFLIFILLHLQTGYRNEAQEQKNHGKID